MKKFFLILATIFILGNSTCAAENLQFIDAMDDTGYYYDADSIRSESGNVFFVQMAVIKASLNRMYTYSIQSNSIGKNTADYGKAAESFFKQFDETSAKNLTKEERQKLEEKQKAARVHKRTTEKATYKTGKKKLEMVMK